MCICHAKFKYEALLTLRKKVFIRGYYLNFKTKYV